MGALNAGREVSQVIHFKAYDLLTATNRMTNGQGYQALRDALERLSGTRISTNITTGGAEIFETFGLIERAKIVRETREGRMQEVEIKLSDWVFNAIKHNEVLTLHRDYFRLRRPLERRIYEIARKHCGYKKEWKITLELLKDKCGSTSTLREFRRLVKNIVRQDQNHGHMPDYAVVFDEENDMVLFTNKDTMKQDKPPALPLSVTLDPDVYHEARMAAPGWDVYELEQQWRGWITEPPRNPNAAFLGFCRKVFEKRGRP